MTYKTTKNPRKAYAEFDFEPEVRDLIEQSPPKELVATFHKLSDAKIKETKALAARAAERYNLLPGLI